MGQPGVMGWTAPIFGIAMCHKGVVETSQREEPSSMKPSTIGLDIAKSVFHLHGVDASGAVVLRKRLRRRELVAYFAKLEPCLIGLEACGGGHHWARELAALGHQVRLLSPADVKPYVRRNKNDAIDAAAICEAVSRPSMRFVPVKSRAQQAALVPHRVRDLLVRQRTMLINTLRSLMAEFGVVAPRGRGHLGALAARLEEPEAASPSNPAIPAASATAATSPPGSAWWPSRARPGAGRGSAASPRWATAICAACWCSAPPPGWPASGASRARWRPGPGLCSPADRPG